MNIGFIGLGNMGAPMAANLATAGHTVTGYDMATPAPEGVTMADDAASAARGADVVITMLPNGTILQSVAADIIPAMTPGAVLLGRQPQGGGKVAPFAEGLPVAQST